jgi:hypothetical protein
MEFRPCYKEVLDAEHKCGEVVMPAVMQFESAILAPDTPRRRPRLVISELQPAPVSNIDIPDGHAVAAGDDDVIYFDVPGPHDMAGWNRERPILSGYDRKH